MRILLTGGSSFTGFWFASELVRRGHRVTAVLRRARDEYEGVRRERVERLVAGCEPVFGCAFGDDRFLELVRTGGGWDALCHHAAQVEGYRSPDFDVLGALASNTREISEVLETLRARGCSRLVLTGSVFESDEGEGSEDRGAFSLYGLSKALTAQVVRHHARVSGFRLGKFVVSNPFGPFEEPRFTDYLVRSWYAGETARVRTPDYVRDNVHVSLLARGYARFVESLSDEPGFERLAPRGYVGSQGQFAQRFARELEPRLGIACRIELCTQKDFSEPRARFNPDVLDPSELDWREDEAWSRLATYYRNLHGAGCRG